MRRKSDERDRPCYAGLLWTDGSVTRVPLDSSEDKFLDREEPTSIIKNGDRAEFLEELSSLGDAAISFSEAINRTMDRKVISQSVREIILKALDEGMKS